MPVKNHSESFALRWVFDRQFSPTVELAACKRRRAGVFELTAAISQSSDLWQSQQSMEQYHDLRSRSTRYWRNLHNDALYDHNGSRAGLRGCRAIFA